MPEYISRDMAKEALYKTAEEYDEYDKCDRIAIIALNNADEILNDIPTADVLEVRHGHWYLDNECAFCSECKNSFTPKIRSQALFCPRCGAKMDGGQE